MLNNGLNGRICEYTEEYSGKGLILPGKTGLVFCECI